MTFCSHLDASLQCQIYSQLEEIRSEWDAFLPSQSALQSRYLNIMEQSELEDFQVFYIRLSRNNRVIGQVVCQIFRFHSGHFDASFLENCGISLFRPILVRQEGSVLICGNLFHLKEPGYFFSEQEDEKHLIPVIEYLSKKRKFPSIMAALIKDPTHSLDGVILKKHRFRTFENDLLMRLPIDPAWTDFSAYQDALSKKYRQRARKIKEAGQSIQMERLSSEQIRENANQIDKLYQLVRMRQSLRIGSLNARYFEAMKSVYGENFELLSWKLDGEMVAFSTHWLHSDGDLEIHYIGFDTKINETHSLYFNILFQGIETAIQKGAQAVQFGRTGYDAKANVGAKAEASTHYYRIKRGFPALAFRLMQAGWDNSNNHDWEKRNPFKEPQPELQRV